MSQSKEQFMQLRSEEMELQQGISFEHLIDAKKNNISNAVATIANEVSAGNYDSLKGLILALKGKALFTDLEAALRPLANDAYLNKIEKNYSAFDCKIEQAAVSTKYDFSVCGDIHWPELVKELEAAKEALKERETFLKTITKSISVNDEDTGEVYTINPPNKLQSDGLKVTLK